MTNMDRDLRGMIRMNGNEKMSEITGLTTREHSMQRSTCYKENERQKKRKHVIAMSFAVHHSGQSLNTLRTLNTVTVGNCIPEHSLMPTVIL